MEEIFDGGEVFDSCLSSMGRGNLFSRNAYFK